MGVLDDRDIIREGLAALAVKDASVTLQWASSTLEAALAQPAARLVKALFVSVDLGGYSFQATTQRLRRQFPSARIVGVVGDPCLWESRVGDRALVDQSFHVSSMTGSLDGPLGRIRRRHPQNEGADAGHLSAREREVLALVALARGNRSIAISLGIAEATVKRHVSSILAKLCSTSRAEAALVARRLGYVTE